MKARNLKTSVVIMFMSIFLMKMAISIAPVFLSLNNKNVSEVIMQLEHETKTEKDDPEKDAFKDKKFFDESLLSLTIYQPFMVETNVLHNLERSLYTELYHPVVPTPPPNV